MASIRTKLFVPVLSGLLGFGALAAYQLIQSPTLPGDTTAMAATDTKSDAPRPAPDFALKDVNGNTVRLSDYKGKVVVLNFWATWCPPCRKEIPDFNELQSVYGSQGVQFLGIALDDEGLAKVKPWVANNPMKYPTLIPDASIKAYGEMTSIPVTFLIDRKGMIRQSYIGARQKSVLEGMMAPLIAEK